MQLEPTETLTFKEWLSLCGSLACPDQRAGGIKKETPYEVS